MTEILDNIRNAIIELDIDNIPKLCEDALNAGFSAYSIVIDGMAKGMEIVGQKYEDGEYFLAELIMAGETMKEGMNVLEPHFKAGELASAGKCVIGTVKGDLHDIGKNIVSILLRGAGYTVKDLGNDIDPQAIAAAVKEEKPQILGLSALLTSTMMNMEDTMKALVDAGVRDNVKVIIGGAPVSEDFARKIGADGYGADGFQAVAVVESLSNA